MKRKNEDDLKKWITDNYEPDDLWSVAYLIRKILGEATAEQLQFIQDALANRL